MVTKKEVASVLEPMSAELKSIDDKTIGEVVGVAQALDELRQALDEVDRCLDTRSFEKAAALGYSSVASSFIFLQRTLGGLNERSMDKQCVVQEVARRLRCSYEEAEPHVNALMHSTKPRPDADTVVHDDSTDDRATGGACDDPDEIVGMGLGDALTGSFSEAVDWAGRKVDLPVRESHENDAEPSASSLEEIPEVDLSKANRLARGKYAKSTRGTVANSLLYALRKRSRWRRRVAQHARVKELSLAPELASVLEAARGKLEGAVIELRRAHQDIGTRAGANELTAREYGTFDMLDDVAAQLLLVLVNMIGKGPDGIDLAATALNEIVGDAVRAFERGYGGEGLSDNSRGTYDGEVIDHEQAKRRLRATIDRSGKP